MEQEREGYFYLTPRLGAAVSEVNNYGDSMLWHSKKRNKTHTQKLMLEHTEVCLLVSF